MEVVQDQPFWQHFAVSRQMKDQKSAKVKNKILDY